jgi:hypothetical protein
MAFGRNPHVPKAVAAEQKASEATDDASRARALRDAAHQWDRAAERETPGPRRAEYERNATKNRESADSGGSAGAPGGEHASAGEASSGDPRTWN